MSLAQKRTKKEEREFQVLLGLVRQYIQTGKPVGSQTLQDQEFSDLSSATIRNYFASLEERGFLAQQHTSGGRIPTHNAYRCYARECQETKPLPFEIERPLQELRESDTSEIAAYLQVASSTLSSLAKSAVFISAPRFDQDFITSIRLVPIDNRCVCVLVTHFGLIQTEVLQLDSKLSSFAAKRIEAYFHWRLTGRDQPDNLEPGEEEIARALYNELLLRYIVSYSSFTEEAIHRTGFATLLSYPEFQDVGILSHGLSLFENAHSMRLLLRECSKAKGLRFWIGDDLLSFSATAPECSVIAIPYCIGNIVVGGVGLLGPMRIPYPERFALIREFASSISEALTRNVYKFKITFRQPNEWNDQILLQQSKLLLLEDQR